MSYSVWANVKVKVQTAIAAALAITAITKASPAVVNQVAHGYNTGDTVKLNITGMTQLHKRSFRVTKIDADHYSLDDEDSTNYGTFQAGSAQKVTLGVEMTTVQDVNASGGEPNFKDLSTIHDQIERQIPTTVSAFNLQFGCLWDMTDAAHQELKKATLEMTERVIEVAFSNGVSMLGNSYISAAGVPTGSAQDVVKTNVAFTMQGLPTILA